MVTDMRTQLAALPNALLFYVSNDASHAKGVADLGADLKVTPAQSASRPQLAILDADAESA